MQDIVAQLNAFIAFLHRQKYLRVLPNAVCQALRSQLHSTPPSALVDIAAALQELAAFLEARPEFLAQRGRYSLHLPELLAILRPLEHLKLLSPRALTELADKADALAGEAAARLAAMHERTQKKALEIRHEMAWVFWISYLGEQTVLHPYEVLHQLKKFAEKTGLYSEFLDCKEKEMVEMLDPDQCCAISPNSISLLFFTL
jgi:hypothetical protein